MTNLELFDKFSENHIPSIDRHAKAKRIYYCSGTFCADCVIQIPCHHNSSSDAASLTQEEVLIVMEKYPEVFL
jgi:hypothetical protein